MSAIATRFGLFLSNKRKTPIDKEVDYGENWRTIETWANKAGGVPAFLAPSAPLDAYTTATPATSGGYPTVNAASAYISNPIESKLFIQSETKNVIPNAGGDSIITFPVPFPNGLLSVNILCGGSGSAVQRVTFCLFPDFTDRSRFTFHTTNEATAAAWTTDLKFCYLALGW